MASHLRIANISDSQLAYSAKKMDIKNVKFS